MKSNVIKWNQMVGAGAAGMCAAIIAARNGADVLILEKNQTVGKKLSMTGNGRCNLSHAGIVPEDYNQSARTYLPSLFRQISEKDVRDFLKSIGVLIREEEGGLYPYSGQASSVVEAFQSEIRHLGIRVIDQVQVKQVIPKNQIFSIRTSSTLYEADAVILSCGGMAGPKSTMSSGDGYYMASKLGMKTIPPLPALVRLKSTDADLPKQSGLRIEARVSFFVREEGKRDRPIATEEGEIQITEGGISGIPVLQASAMVASALSSFSLTGKQRMIAKLNFFPDYSDQEYHNICEERKTAEEKPSARRTVQRLFSFSFNGNDFEKEWSKAGDGCRVGVFCFFGKNLSDVPEFGNFDFCNRFFFQCTGNGRRRRLIGGERTFGVEKGPGRFPGRGITECQWTLWRL